MAGKKIAAVGILAIVLISVGAYVYIRAPSTTGSTTTPELSEVDDFISELESYMDFENMDQDIGLDGLSSE